jgi:hypothetical protein
MEPLIIKATDSTPNITMDKVKGVFEISGNSLPENVIAFYEPAMKWVKEYVNNPNPSTNLVFKLTYLNTASSKTIYSLMSLLEPLVDKGNKIQIDWWYMEIDEDTLEAGKEYEGMVNIPFKFFQLG